MAQRTHAYDDIIDLPHHISERHAHMSMEMRAAQFAPFAALTGYEDAARETERLTDPRVALAEDARAALAETLRALAAAQARRPRVTVRYFLPDRHKDGGAYRTVTGLVKRIDAGAGTLALTNGAVLPLADIFEIDAAPEVWEETVP